MFAYVSYEICLFKNSIIFLDNNEIGSKKQTDQEVLKYVIKNGKVIDKVLNYDIYVLGG